MTRGYRIPAIGVRATIINRVYASVKNAMNERGEGGLGGIE